MRCGAAACSVSALPVTRSDGAGDRNGPGLYDVVGKPVASNSRRVGYKGALRSAGGVWTPEKLDIWLAAPAKFAPVTSMIDGDAEALLS